MKKYLLPVFSLLMISFIFSSCAKDDNDDGCTNDLSFIEVGNKFTYSFEKILEPDTTFTIEIMGNPSSTNFEVRYTGGWYATYGDVYWKACGGQFSVNDNESDSKDKNVVYKKDAAVNDSWVGQNSSSSSATRTLIQKSVSVTTPAGTFVCDVYTSQVTGAFNTDTIWMSEDVGFVKYDGFLFDYELLSINF